MAYVCQACVALATFVLPVAVSDAESMGAAVQKIEAALDMPLLLRAVRSQSMPLVGPPSPCACIHLVCCFS